MQRSHQPIPLSLARTASPLTLVYTMTDSADRIYVYEDASAMTGDVPTRPYRIIDVVNQGYGMDVLSY